MLNSVRKGFVATMTTGSSRRLQRYSSALMLIEVYPPNPQQSELGLKLIYGGRGVSLEMSLCAHSHGWPKPLFTVFCNHHRLDSSKMYQLFCKCAIEK